MIHKSEVPGYENRMDDLVEEIGNLRYDRLADFLHLLAQKIDQDGQADYQRQRFKLATSLKNGSEQLRKAKTEIELAWTISKPFMNDNLY